jgi:hypothetical protein
VNFGTGFGGITDLRVGPDGFLYVVSIGDGKIYVIRPAGPTFGISSLSNGEVDLAYDVDLNIGGGTPPYEVTVIKGKLPVGLDPVGEKISGLPTRAGTKSFTLQVTDADQASTSKKFRIKVVKALKIRTTSLKAGQVNKPYNAILKANRGQKPFTWSHTGSLPAWATLNPDRQNHRTPAVESMESLFR